MTSISAQPSAAESKRTIQAFSTFTGRSWPEGDGRPVRAVTSPTYPFLPFGLRPISCHQMRLSYKLMALVELSAMTEKILSAEIHPMRGHSRGDWYCSLDDIAPNEDEAEYWAAFGVTHRGNKHCLGEFPTRFAAESAVGVFSSIRNSAGVQLHTDGKSVVKMEVVQDSKDKSKRIFLALCANGTIWRRIAQRGSDAEMIVDHWQSVPISGREDLTPQEAFRLVAESLR